MSRFLVAFGALAIAVVACDATFDVGDVHTQPPTGIDSDASAEASTPGVPSWRTHGPSVPCSIHAMAEVATDRLYLGCRGGQIWRWDGVTPEIAYSVSEDAVVSLMWAAPGGSVYAGAQTGVGPTATTQLIHFDGTTWTPIAGPAKRVTSLGGFDAQNVWITTDDAIYRLNPSGPEQVYTTTAGAFRDCAFTAADKGWCGGTNGLLVTWNGTSWSTVTGLPWSATAEVLGIDVELFSHRPMFFYGEPITHPNGTHSCRLAYLEGTTFTALTASTPCFPDAELGRKRTGTVTAGGRAFMLLSPEPDYGGALLYDRVDDTVRELCGAILSFAQGPANTRVGGRDGLLGTLVGSGGNQIAVSAHGGSNLEINELSVAPDGTPWARVGDATVCGSITEHLRRFEDGAWRPIAGPDVAQHGRGLAAVGHDHVFTLDIVDNLLLEYGAGTWFPGRDASNVWSLHARAANDVFVGGYNENLGHWDGKSFTMLMPEDRTRQVTQVLAIGDEVWLSMLGTTVGDTDRRVVRWSKGARFDWNVGLEDPELSGVDATHLWRTGRPAQRWNGEKWSKLPFEADHVWARTANEVYFTRGGSIFLWDGRKEERVYRGFIGISAIGGTLERGFAVGAGGLSLELGVWPTPPPK